MRFFFLSNDKEDVNYVLVTKKQQAEFSHVNWIYSPNHPYAALVGILKNGSIFAIDGDFDKRVLCYSFFDIPFVLAELYVTDGGGATDDKRILLTDKDYAVLVNNLRKYIVWCKDNGYPLKAEYLNYFD